MSHRHKGVPIDPPPPRVSARPLCPECGERLRPAIVEEWDGPGHVCRSRSWRGGYHAYGHFCTLRCAATWANREWGKRTGKGWKP